jgi:methyl-accepting chemotaxis protein
MQRSLSEGTSREAVVKFEKLIGNIAEDLNVVRDRVRSANVSAAREKVESKLRDWSGAGLKILKRQSGGLTEIPTTFVVAQLGADAIAAVDDLVEMVAAYGFEFRTEAEATVAQAHSTMLALAIGTALVGLLIAAGFAYSLSCSPPCTSRNASPPEISPTISRPGAATNSAACSSRWRSCRRA